MEPEGSLPHLQVPATCPYPKPAQCIPYSHIPLPEDPSYYYPPIYTRVSPVVLETLHESSSTLSTQNYGVPFETDCYLALSSRCMRPGAYFYTKEKKHSNNDTESTKRHLVSKANLVHGFS
jgi:hypothetical protein